MDWNHFGKFIIIWIYSLIELNEVLHMSLTVKEICSLTIFNSLIGIDKDLIIWNHLVKK